MPDTFKISCRVAANDKGLSLSIKIDDRTIWQGDPYGGHDVVYEMSEIDGKHELCFELSGKTIEHTKIDSEGNITQDITITIADLSFDDIKLGHLLTEKAIYRHDFNGNGSITDAKFFDTMGCNGTVTLAFNTPIYLWLLENM